MKWHAAGKRNESPARQLVGFIEKFDPAVGKLLKATRSLMRKRLPTAYELVYDNYNFLVIGYCTRPLAYDALLSLAAHARGVILSFYQGASLPDPKGVLLGSGKQNRFIRIGRAGELQRPEVEALIEAASAQAKAPLLETGGGELIIQSISAKQRPRRREQKRGGAKGK